MGFTPHNLDGYGGPAIEWDTVADALATSWPQEPGSGGPDRHTPWLTTINDDGSAHVTPVGTVQLDGTWYFTSGPGTRKSRNLDRDPRCVFAQATSLFDLVLHGHAERVTASSELQSAVQSFNREGWPCRIDGDAVDADYSAPSAGPGPWHLYRVTVQTVYAFGTREPYGATRFEEQS